jgi:putative GTP pyrophosphokinase
MADLPQYPGGSRERVGRAGDAVRDETATAEDLRAIYLWRGAHAYVINSFQAMLRGRTKDQDIAVVQRHKRRTTIFGKLRRFPKMRLHRMDDVAGCRLIFPDIEALYQFREQLHNAKFQHKLRNDPDKYDYIKAPKADGYRGIHDIYVYDVRGKGGAAYKGLQIELQYRTVFQHAWATCVEVVGFVTKSNPKFKQGDKRYEQIMVLASELIARVWEGRKGPLPDLASSELISRFSTLNEELGFIDMLRALNANDEVLRSRSQNLILIFTPDEPLEIRAFSSDREAVAAMLDLEIDAIFGDKDIVAVRGNKKDVRNAFRNYFTDARDFLQYIDEALMTITDHMIDDGSEIIMDGHALEQMLRLDQAD